MHTASIFSAATLVTFATAGRAPSYPGFSSKWEANFDGDAGSTPSSGLWNVISKNLGVNNELQTYTSSPKNVQKSGQGTLQLVALKDSHGAWTSGRIESKYTFTPKKNARTIVEARIRFGTDSKDKRQGIWPAFWMLGDSCRHGTNWPDCGEIDVMENINGQMTIHGTIHCKKPSADSSCDDSMTVPLPDYGWHTYRVEWNLKDPNWMKRSINFYLDDKMYASPSGVNIRDHKTWNILAESPVYFILNLAVGGDWPGNPNSQTTGGTGSMMEVDYVAHYEEE